MYKILVNKIERKNKKGSKGMAEPNCMTRNYNIHTKQKYLNVLVNLKKSHAGMEEWLSRLHDTQCPSGFVGSIPAAGVTSFIKEKKNE